MIEYFQNFSSREMVMAILLSCTFVVIFGRTLYMRGLRRMNRKRAIREAAIREEQYQRFRKPESQRSHIGPVKRDS